MTRSISITLTMECASDVPDDALFKKMATQLAYCAVREFNVDYEAAGYSAPIIKGDILTEWHRRRNTTTRRRSHGSVS